MSWNPNSSLAPVSRWWGTLAFRLTAGYALAGVFLVFLATASLYLVLVSELEASTDLFLADKVHVLCTMLRERPDDRDALREEIELESAARRYEHFYIRLLDERNTPLMMTPGMADQLDLEQLTRQTQSRPGRTLRMKGRNGQAFRVTSASAPVGFPATQTDTLQIAIDVSQKEESLAHFRFWFWVILLATSAIFPLVGYPDCTARHSSGAGNGHDRAPHQFNEPAGTNSSGRISLRASIAGQYLQPNAGWPGRVVRADFEILGGHRARPADAGE